jgi:geranylgeranyl reductase family protein
LDYDLIVIGAGPAGASAAAEAAKVGLRVALIEKQRLPRHKTCGGGMPMVTGEILREFAPGAVVEAEARYMRHTWRFEDPVFAAINPPGTDRDISLWMVQRSLFDNAVTELAVRAGAQLRDEMTARQIEIVPEGVRIQAENSRTGKTFQATARHLIGADGANGITAKAAGLRQNRTLAIAMEVEHPHVWGTGHPELRQDVIHLEYGAVTRGYAWVFPKGDHLNVGAGVFRPRKTGGPGDPTVSRDLRRAIFGYLDMLQVPYKPEKMKFYAHPLPIWQGRERVSDLEGRILLVGDAAGLINPLFGDGILHAIKSGQIAARCIAEGNAFAYTARIHAEFGDNFDAAFKLARFFYEWTGLVYRLGVKRESSTRTAARLLCGDALFTDVAGRAIRRLRRGMFGKVSGSP